MRFTRKDVSGLERTRTKESHRPNTWRGYSPAPKKEMSEDTKIRKDINETIFSLVEKGKSDIEIEIHLTGKYPDYSEYIRKMISNYLAKLNLKRAKENEVAKVGDER